MEKIQHKATATTKILEMNQDPAPETGRPFVCDFESDKEVKDILRLMRMLKHREVNVQVTAGSVVLTSQDDRKQHIVQVFAYCNTLMPQENEPREALVVPVKDLLAMLPEKDTIDTEHPNFPVDVPFTLKAWFGDNRATIQINNQKLTGPTTNYHLNKIDRSMDIAFKDMENGYEYQVEDRYDFYSAVASARCSGSVLTTKIMPECIKITTNVPRVENADEVIEFEVKAKADDDEISSSWVYLDGDVLLDVLNQLRCYEPQIQMIVKRVNKPYYISAVSAGRTEHNFDRAYAHVFFAPISRL